LFDTLERKNLRARGGHLLKCKQISGGFLKARISRIDVLRL
jgi:hypothetical protein